MQQEISKKVHPAPLTAHVEFISNRTVFSSEDLAHHWPGIVRFNLPDELIPAVLHETTHHWCFASPVGTALSALMLEAQRLALEPGRIGREAAKRIVSNHLTYNSVIEMTRPLAEGLALFAEHDVTPSVGHESSPVMKTISQLLKTREVEGISKDDPDHTIQLLRLFRLEPKQIDRRAHLLVQPMGFSHHGYLPGYVAVKSLWHHLVANRHVERFFNRDAFLTYIRSYIYEDCELVALLLERDEPFPYLKLLNHFKRRILQLWDTNNISAHVDLFFGENKSYQEALRVIQMEHPRDAKFEYSVNREFQLRLGIMQDLNRASLGRILLRESYDVSQIHKQSLISKTIDTLLFRKSKPANREGQRVRLLESTAFWKHRMQQRSLIYLGRMDGRVTVLGESAFFWDHNDQAVVGGPFLPDVDKVPGEGSLEIFLSYDEFQIFMRIERCGQVIAVLAIAKKDEPEKFVDLLIQSVFTQDEHAEWLAEYEEIVSKLLRRPSFQRIAAEASTSVHRDRRSLYGLLDMYIFEASMEEKNRQLDLMEENGFWPILGEDEEAVRAAAAISAVDGGTEATVRGLFENQYKINYDRAVRKLRDVCSKTGLRAFVERDGHIGFWI